MCHGQNGWSVQVGMSPLWNHGQHVWGGPVVREQSRALELRDQDTGHKSAGPRHRSELQAKSGWSEQALAVQHVGI